MSDSEGSSKKIKVVDRRRFAEDGSPRRVIEQQQAPEPEPAPAVPPPDASPRTAEPAPRPTVASAQSPPRAGSETSQEFVELVAMLAQQAEMMLVGAEDLPAHPAQAKRLIDYLGALETKTQGNLSVEEQRLLSNIVFELRTMYVQATR